MGGKIGAQIAHAEVRSAGGWVGVHYPRLAQKVYIGVRMRRWRLAGWIGTVPLMNFAFSEEQDQLREFVRSFLEEKSSEDDVREQMETDQGYDEAVWNQMAEQMGLQALAIPEEYGGQGFGFIEQVVVLEEMGRALLCAPYFSSCVLAAKTPRTPTFPALRQVRPGPRSPSPRRVAAGTKAASPCRPPRATVDGPSTE